MITATNILAHELIGLDAKIIETTNAALSGLAGTIVFETKNTLAIRSGSATKIIPKAAAKKIKIATQNGACFISGSSMIARPEDRISRL
ncbi:ribonuclease P protein component 1 [Nitrososphaera viennensis]|nr:ribonuclease P protein subunit [Nitrososphaera viennensis]UVS69664.1 ribonuclease P protein subunit [Nitrososphaera viennensis]